MNDDIFPEDQAEERLSEAFADTDAQITFSRSGDYAAVVLGFAYRRLARLRDACQEHGVDIEEEGVLWFSTRKPRRRVSLLNPNYFPSAPRPRTEDEEEQELRRHEQALRRQKAKDLAEETLQDPPWVPEVLELARDLIDKRPGVGRLGNTEGPPLALAMTARPVLEALYDAAADEFEKWLKNEQLDREADEPADRPSKKPVPDPEPKKKGRPPRWSKDRKASWKKYGGILSLAEQERISKIAAALKSGMTKTDWKSLSSWARREKHADDSII